MADYGERKPVAFNHNETISEAIKAGERIRELKALRNVLAAHLDNTYTPASAVATLSRQYRDLSEEIERLEAQQDEKSNGEATVTDISDADWTLHAI